MLDLQKYNQKIVNCSDYISSLIGLNPSVFSATYGSFSTPHGTVTVRPVLDGEEPCIVIGYPSHPLTSDGANRIEFVAYFMLNSGSVEAEFNVIADNQYTPRAEELRNASNHLSSSLGLLFGDYIRYLQAHVNSGTAKELDLHRVRHAKSVAPEKLAVANLPYNAYITGTHSAVKISTIPSPDGVETVLFVCDKDYVSVSIEINGAMVVTAGRVSESGGVQSWERPQTGSFGDFVLPEDYLAGRISEKSIGTIKPLFNIFLQQYN